MGNVICRYKTREAQRHSQNQKEPPHPRPSQPDSRPSLNLQGKLAAAKKAFSERKQQRTAPFRRAPEIKYLQNLQIRQLPGSQGDEQRQQEQHMRTPSQRYRGAIIMDEVIYIPEDEVPLAFRAERRLSSEQSSSVQVISKSSPCLSQESGQEGFYDPSEIQSAAERVSEPVIAGSSRSAADPQDLEFMDDVNFDWERFLEERRDDASNLYPGNQGADDNMLFGFDQSRLDIPILPANPLIRKAECVDGVLAVFPDICVDFVSDMYDEEVSQVAENLVARILDSIEKGRDYPKAKDTLKTLKRKREVDSEEEEERIYGSADRKPADFDYAAITRQILQGEFSDTPMLFIDATLNQTKSLLFPAYRILEEAERTWNVANPPYNRIKNRRKANKFYAPEEAERALQSEATTSYFKEALRELQTARRVRKKAESKRQTEKEAKLAEEENVSKAMIEGTMLECGCCFSEHPLNRMVHCENDSIHWFCRSCAKQTAENEIGNQKYEIRCMSMEGCEAGFSRHEKTVFLDETSLIALDRNEQEAMLRLAGIENLESCPFCPFAAEYPPIAENKEFRCQSEECEKISCRLCRLESHIPKTCEESAKDNGLSIRRQIEEAMSAALIRKCNKCGTPFVKEEGCNKMMCTRSGCGNVQCYVCSKSCQYNHFNDQSRGGKAGNCPLFESVEERHEEEVKRAEKEAVEKVRAEHPEYSEDDLKIKVSEKVRQDEERRRASAPRIPRVAPVAAFGRPGQALGGNVVPVPRGLHQIKNVRIGDMQQNLGDLAGGQGHVYRHLLAHQPGALLEDGQQVEAALGPNHQLVVNEEGEILEVHIPAAQANFENNQIHRIPLLVPPPPPYAGPFNGLVDGINNDLLMQQIQPNLGDQIRQFAQERLQLDQFANHRDVIVPPPQYVHIGLDPQPVRPRFRPNYPAREAYPPPVPHLGDRAHAARPQDQIANLMPGQVPHARPAHPGPPEDRSNLLPGEVPRRRRHLHYHQQHR